jgi:hypothetical protein
MRERAAILFKQLALGRLKHLFAWGKVTAEQRVELRCQPSRSVRIWKRWLDIKAEVAGVIFEVPARLAYLPDLSQPDTRTLVYYSIPPALGCWRVLGRRRARLPSLLVGSKWTTSGREGVTVTESAWDAIGRASSRYQSGPQERRLPSRSAG